MTENAEFGQLLRELRTKAGRSMGDVARELKVSVSYVSDVERGGRPPFVKDKIVVVAKFLGEKDLKQLLLAGGRSRGAFELDARHVRPRAQEVGAALTRRWTDLSDEQLDQISAIVEGDG